MEVIAYIPIVPTITKPSLCISQQEKLHLAVISAPEPRRMETRDCRVGAVWNRIHTEDMGGSNSLPC